MKTIKDYICPDSYNYYYGELYDEAKSYYKTLFENLLAFKEEFEIAAEQEWEVTATFKHLKLDVPELFYVQEIECKKEGKKIIVRPIYSYSEGEVLRTFDAVSQKYDSFISTCKNKSTLDKAIFIYMLLGSTIAYNSSESFHHQGLPTLLHNEGCCEGVAHAFKYLSDIVGLKSIIVVGQEKDGLFGHAWNAVLIGDSFVYIDALAGVPGSGKDFYSHFGISNIYEHYHVFYGPNKNDLAPGGIINRSKIKLKLLTYSYRFNNNVIHSCDTKLFHLALKNNGYLLFVDFLVFILVCSYRIFLGTILSPILFGKGTLITWLIFVFCELLPLVKFSISAAHYGDFVSDWKKYYLVFFAFAFAAFLSISSFVEISLVFGLKQITFLEILILAFLLLFFITPTHRVIAAFSD